MRLFIIHIFLFIGVFAIAQNTWVSGTIVDKDTGEPLPFVNVVCASDPGIGTSSDTLGIFNLHIPQNETTLIISFVGYEKLHVAVSEVKGKKNRKIELVPILNEIEEISVRPGLNPANTLVKNIHANRKRNDPDNISPIETMVYSRTTVAMEQLDKRLVENPMFNNLDEALISTDDTTVLMPLVLSEELLRDKRDFSKNINERQQLNINNNGLSFFNSPQMMAFVAPITDRVNFYNNYIQIMNRDFASPLAFNGTVNYKYLITDTLIENNKTQYKVIYWARRVKDLAFNGYFWVEDSTFAITEFYADLNPKANINIIKQLKVHNTFKPVTDSTWFYKKQHVYVTFRHHLNDDTTKKQVTIVANKTANYYPENASELGLQLNPEDAGKVKIPSRHEKEALMNQFRTQEADSLYNSMDHTLNQMKKNPVVQQTEKLLDMGLKGYYNAGIIDIGPFLNFYRTNAIEGDRFTIPMRTSQQLSEYFSVGGYYGFGSVDKKSKYGGNLFLKYPKSRYTIMGLQYWDDIAMIGYNDHLSLVKENAYTLGEDNIISSMFQINQNTNMSRFQQFSAFVEHDWKQGFTHKIKFDHNRAYEGIFVPFTKGTENIPFIEYNEVSLLTRLSFNENYYDAFFHRIFFGNRYPVINLMLTAGNYTTGFDSQNYYKVHLSFKHKIVFGSIFLRYLVEAGHIFGDMPFPLLELHRGNETYGYARYYFNLLNNMEYASDSYVNIHSTLYLNGLILNKIPLIRALELREVISFKGIVGSLSDKHRNIMDFPEGLEAVHSPYAEVGIGVTNLLRVFRVEYVKRLTDVNKEGIKKDGIRFRFEFNF